MDRRTSIQNPLQPSLIEPTLPTQFNPFAVLQSRYLILGTYLLASFIVGVTYGLLTRFGVLPWSETDLVAIPIQTIAVWIVTVGVILQRSRDEGISLSQLYGSYKTRFSWLYGLLLVASLLIFSMGSFSVVFYLLSLSFPDYAAGILESNLMPGSGLSAFPRLYDGLMLFSLLVCAPLAEELVFRGFLLQRWATKWGLRWGVVASSLLFGVMHVNNPVGLTLFGVVMALLYIRTQSLWVPIVCHFLNNLAAYGLDQVDKLLTAEPAEPVTVAMMQENWFWGLVLMGISLPLLWRFLRRSWPGPNTRIPYLVNEANSQ